MNKKSKQAQFSNTARRTMTDCQIRPDGVVRKDILKAFSDLPREAFLPQNLHGIAYMDDILTIDKARFILAPSVHARMVEALDPKDKHIALDISVSNGYSPAILASVVSTVIAVENSEDRLNEMARACADNHIYNVAGVNNALKEGAPEHAPFDLIFIHGSVKKIPVNIAAQLKSGGLLVCIIQDHKQAVGHVTLVRKTFQGTYTSKVLFETTAPYIPGFTTSSEGFVF